MTYNPNKVYVVFDGTSHYAVYGCDAENEQIDNDAEIVDGPFDEWNDEVDAIVEKMNYYAQY